MLIATLVLSFATLVTLIRAIPDSVKEIKIDVSGGIGYALGCLLVIVVLIIIIRFMFKWSLKLISTKAQPEDAIDEIGQDK